MEPGGGPRSMEGNGRRAEVTFRDKYRLPIT